METAAAKMPISERINFRIVGFVGVMALLIGSLAWFTLSSFFSKGIHDRGTYKEVDLKMLGYFDFDGINGTIDDVPKRYRELKGQRVLLRGEMYSSEAVDQAARFQLVWSIAKCCFGGPPKVQERVFANVRRGTVPLYGGIVAVTGILRVDIRKEEGRIVSVYELDVEKVEPL